MEIEDLNNKRVMHIDTSCKLYENKDTGIAYKIIGTNLHKGLVITKKIKKDLKKHFSNIDLAIIYAIAIFYLINNDLGLFDILVICSDEKFSNVKKYLNLLFYKNNDYSNKKIMSIEELRLITGNKKLNSYADKISGSYRRRGLKSLIRQQEGINLNNIKINYKMIEDCIIKINKL